jgi:hypothetical protein
MDMPQTYLRTVRYLVVVSLAHMGITDTWAIAGARDRTITMAWAREHHGWGSQWLGLGNTMAGDHSG